jgi:hypothetical protein
MDYRVTNSIHSENIYNSVANTHSSQWTPHDLLVPSQAQSAAAIERLYLLSSTYPTYFVSMKEMVGEKVPGIPCKSC